VTPPLFFCVVFGKERANSLKLLALFETAAVSSFVA